MKRHLIILIALLTALVSRAETVISLLTCSPGRDVYELEGHTAMRFLDTETGEDRVVNWGIFDFHAPGFVYRFVKGETNYMAGAVPTDVFMSVYASEGRAVTEQRLNLTPSQIEHLIALVDTNLLPENRVYRYKYLTDNCATRPLSIIEKACDKRVTNPDDAPEVSTWRREMRNYHRNYPWYQFGIDLALGSGLDKKISTREKTFAPVFLSKYLLDAGIAGQPTTLLPGKKWGEPAGPTPWILSPMAVALLFLIITSLITWRQLRRLKITRWYYTAFFTVMAIAGCLVTFLVVVSEHEATSPNWLLLWLNPFCLFPAIAIWLKKLNHAVFCYQIVNFALLIILLLIFAIGVQSPNPAFIPWILSDMILSGSYIWINIKTRH